MNRELLELSYALRKKRQKRIMNLIFFIVSLFAAVLLVRTFLVFSVREKSVSMLNDIPAGAHIFLTPIVGSPKRGDVLLVKRLGRERSGVLPVLFDELSRFITAQQFSTKDLRGLMGSHTMLRRVAALPGDTIYMRGNVLFVKPKGEEYFLTEFERTALPYNTNITTLPAFWDTHMGVYSDMEEVTLGEDEYYLLSDNRVSAFDCRMWGPVKLDDVKARALLLFFPFNKIHLL